LSPRHESGERQWGDAVTVDPTTPWSKTTLRMSAAPKGGGGHHAKSQNCLCQSRNRAEIPQRLAATIGAFTGSAAVGMVVTRAPVGAGAGAATGCAGP